MCSRLISGSRLKTAALGGLLACCSNDIAFGLPIVDALHPSFGIYIVLTRDPLRRTVSAFNFQHHVGGLVDVRHRAGARFSPAFTQRR